MAVAPFHIGEPFKPAPQFRTYMYSYLTVFVVVLILPWLIPAVILSPLPVALGIGIPTLAVVLFVLYWIPLYYESVVFRLTVTEISWQRGVWFRQTGIVPYNRITNVDILQGPLMRFYAFSAVRVQTAGYSGQARAEIILNGIEDPRDLQEKIMSYVRKICPVATEGEPEQAAAGGEANATVVKELQGIRKLLEALVEK
jgi:membrane protein YdbS with pleckstrin-like domain